MAGFNGVFIIDCVADAHSQVMFEVYHSLFQESPDVGCQACDDDWNMCLSRTVPFGFDDPQACGGPREVQGIIESETQSCVCGELVKDNRRRSFA
jgi:hypothetical protein